MTSPVRIACINPRCRRTAPKTSFPSEIVCGKCWRTLPRALTERYRQLRRRDRRITQRIERRLRLGLPPTPATMNRLEMTIERARNDNWQAIRRWFAEPDRPAGLNGFLQEMGMA